MLFHHRPERIESGASGVEKDAAISMLDLLGKKCTGMILVANGRVVFCGGVSFFSSTENAWKGCRKKLGTQNV